MRTNSRYFYLDLLKATSILLVLFWHLQPLQFFTSQNRAVDLWDALPQMLVLLFNHQVSLIAVPTFVLVSIFLFFQKASYDTGYFVRRIRRIFILYLVWTLVQTLVYLLLNQCSYCLRQLGNPPNFSVTQMILEGGPELPMAGPSVFYFLFVLLGLTIMASFFISMLMSKKRSLKISPVKLSLAIIVAFLAYFEWSTVIYQPLKYWSISNFILYIPIAYLLHQYIDTLTKKHLTLIACIFVIFSVHDFYLRSFSISPGHYSRISIVAGTVLFFCVIYKLRSVHASTESFPRGWIGFLATYSLGIFALHKYFYVLSTLFLRAVIPFLPIRTAVEIPGMNLSIEFFHLILGLTTLVSTLLVVWLLGKTPLRRFVT